MITVVIYQFINDLKVEVRKNCMKTCGECQDLWSVKECQKKGSKKSTQSPRVIRKPGIPMAARIEIIGARHNNLQKNQTYDA